MHKIYNNWASEIHEKSSSYQLIVAVDKTRSNATFDRLKSFFDDMKIICGEDDERVPLPLVFSVTEDLILQEYPKIRSYLFNEPIPNYGNVSGHCYDRSFMWQIFLPITSLCMHRLWNLSHAWEIEDDIDVFGKHTLLEIIQLWDLAMSDKNVDLAGQLTRSNVSPWNLFTFERHLLGSKIETVSINLSAPLGLRILVNLILFRLVWNRYSSTA
jgi:hypothetical protein